MHFFAIVMIPPSGNVKRHVERLMEPHREDWIPDPEGGLDEYGDEKGELVGFWDWYQIGGRWKGVLASEYDQDKDPDHLESCWLCAGSGRRNDISEADWAAYKAGPMNGCNGCKGTGKKVKWPTNWKPHYKDVIPVAEYITQFIANDKCRPYQFIAEGFNLERDGLRDITKTEMQPHDEKILEYLKNAPDDARVVVVDYHC